MIVAFPPRTRSIAALTILMAVSPLGAGAAQRHTEEFDGGQAAWVKSGSWTLSATNGYLQGSFAPLPGPSAEIASLVATNSSSSGSFTGNYSAAGIQLCGLSFQAVDVLPSDVVLRWRGGTNAYFKLLTPIIARTGEWFHVLVSLESKVAGNWNGSPTSSFAGALADVKSFEVQVTRNGTSAQRYRLDRFFVDAIAGPSAVALGPDGATRVVWEAVHRDIPHMIQATTNLLTGPWVSVGPLPSTNGTVTWRDADSTNLPFRCYRLDTPGY
jgi:hypothetical protein